MEKGNAKTLLTMLGEGSVLEGTLSVPHSVRVDGTLKGKLDTAETLTVGANGVLEADLRARNAIIGGKVIGNITVEERVELESHASLTGDLKARTLVINEGATFQGKSIMAPDAVPASRSE